MTSPAGDPQRRPGRPRKWVDDAERARAYRQRRAAELAQPDQLRADRRALRRDVTNLRRQLTETERALDRIRRERDRALGQLAARTDELAAARAELERLRASHHERERPTTTSPAEPAGNRAQRRRAARARPKH